MIIIDYNKCCWKDGKCTSCCGDKCEGCAEVCPTGALERQDNLVFYPDKCVGCDVCITACKHGAIKKSN